MAIIAPQTAENGAVGEYWRILKTELLCGPKEPIPRYHHILGFYASAAQRDQRPELPMWTESIFVTIADIVARGRPDPRTEHYADIMLDPRFAGTNAASDADTSPPKPLLPPEVAGEQPSDIQP